VYSVRHQNDGTEITGLDAFKEDITNTRKAMPDLKITYGDLIVQGDMMCRMWTATGTNTGPGEYPPTGKAASVNGVTVSKLVKNSKKR